ncbi:MAG: aminotransferase class V-fold PLP-dependent enzyme [Nitrospinota bacterium]
MTIYLDNAATSFPKPPEVIQAVTNVLRRVGGNPGRGGLPAAGDLILFEAREKIAEFFKIPNSSRLIFTPNGTTGLNIALNGILKNGDHVITSSVEHNAVMRPLWKGEKKGRVTFSKVKCSSDGTCPLDSFEKEIRPETKMIGITHASNVSGAILPLEKIGEIARKRGLLFLVDAAQTAGHLPIDVQKCSIDVLACTGHKALLGPQGTGFLYIREGIVTDTLIEGGTGSDSERDEMPEFFPDRHEAGTLNTPGISGLFAAIKFISGQGIEIIRKKELSLLAELIEGLRRNPKVILYGPKELSDRVSLVSFNIKGMDPALIGTSLLEKYKIKVRVGLHCSPEGHKTLGTFPEGTVRASVGYFTSSDDVRCLVDAVNEISGVFRV